MCLFLGSQDFIHLLQTSRDNYASTIPHFWRHLDLEDDRRVDQLITSPAALDSLAKNLPLVCTLKAGFFFISYYFEGVMRYLDEQEEANDVTVQPHATTSTSAHIERPLWLPEAIIRSPPARALLPMTRLTRLDVSFDRRYRGILFDNAMRLNKPIRLFRPLAWLMNLNSTGLTHVSFRHMDLPEPLELRCFARSLSKLTNLTHLQIEMPLISDRVKLVPWLSAPMTSIIFFACPQSVVSIRIKGSMYMRNDDIASERRMRAVQAERDEDDDDEEELERFLDWEEGDVIAREKPLENLKVLITPYFQMGYSSELMRRIKKHCPALEAWDGGP
ncbi:hypothetical protein EC991_001847 [Linnemannia zychae]|nr:hypothetical protein EC991_001847 [Linnemannia zychae]